MNGKKKILLMLAVLWVFVFVAYLSFNPDSIQIQHASQYNSGGFKAISNLATGYFNDTNKQLSHMPKMLP